ncbi:hypothetical protein BDV98DRAFT_590026 [Pterulicium gracile]|uniref:Uncharacterized protein n=1 Tax=Pterulicium gracile TaxID=1884261 RepID=A0A5C3QY56_9AGAR|nr:hypothetical protein BDV98DRAFT_590026 [Pterula gracilis]
MSLGSNYRLRSLEFFSETRSTNSGRVDIGASIVRFSRRSHSWTGKELEASSGLDIPSQTNEAPNHTTSQTEYTYKSTGYSIEPPGPTQPSEISEYSAPPASMELSRGQRQLYRDTCPLEMQDPILRDGLAARGRERLRRRNALLSFFPPSDVFSELAELVLTNGCSSWPERSPRFVYVEGPTDSSESRFEPHPDSWTYASCDDLLKRLIRSVDGKPPLFPKLKTLKIVETRFDPNLLAQVIRKRTVQREGSEFAQLQRVEIDYIASKPSENATFHKAHSQLAREYASGLEAGLVGNGLKDGYPSFELVHDPRQFRVKQMGERMQHSADSQADIETRPASRNP